jgi:hypothetical protein
MAFIGTNPKKKAETAVVEAGPARSQRAVIAWRQVRGEPYEN